MSWTKAFYARNLFERLIFYIFISELLVTLVFELGMGKWYYLLSHHKQFIFFGLVALDYVVCASKIVQLRVQFNYMFVLLWVLLFMVLQGVLVGVFNHNRPFEIFNDTVPLLIMIFNALRMQSLTEGRRPVDFSLLLLSCTVMGFLICAFGQLGQLMGLPSRGSLSALTAGIFLALFFAGLISGKKINWLIYAVFFVTMALSIENINRTALAFISICMMFLLGRSFMSHPVKGIGVIVLAVLIASVAWMSLPEESATYRRIVGLTEIDFAARTGSVGERQMERDSIEKELQQNGATAVVFGMGHGGLYSMQSTHEYIEDTGHAHFSWALFNLRYGMTGYGYLFILAAGLAFHAYRNLRFSKPVHLTVALLCIQSILYLFTYTNFIFLLAGLPLYMRPRVEANQQSPFHDESTR